MRQRWRVATLIVAVSLTTRAPAAGTSPLAEWQASAGVLFDQLEDQPHGWITTLGMEGARLAAYAGAPRDREWTLPVVDLRYGKRWFISTEEGLGYNLPTPPTIRAGVALTYDYGRPANQGPNQALSGINAAPEIKLYYEQAFTPVLLRADLRRAVGGYNGWVADLSAYAALPLSQDLVLMAGPALTFADRHYQQRYFGIDSVESAAGAGPAYAAHGGLESASLGANLVWSIGEHWGVEGYGARDVLLGSAADSPARGALSHLGGGAAVLYQF